MCGMAKGKGDVNATFLRPGISPPTKRVACPHATVHKKMFSSQFWLCMIIFLNNKEDENPPPLPTNIVACSHATLHGYSLGLFSS